MCRYGTASYKPHYACFSCRKTFKRKLLRDLNKASANPFENAEAKCPQCGGLVANMGLDFKSPKSTDLKAWQHTQNLYTVDVTFHSCGCSGPGYIPADAAALLQFLLKRKEEYVDNLRFWLTAQQPLTKQEQEIDNRKNWHRKFGLPNNIKEKKGNVENAEAIRYWTNKLTELDKRISLVK